MYRRYEQANSLLGAFAEMVLSGNVGLKAREAENSRLPARAAVVLLHPRADIPLIGRVLLGPRQYLAVR